jgi:hypothetical protein
MTTIRIGLALLATLLGTSAHAWTLDLMERKVARYATTAIDDYRNPCLCTEFGSYGHTGIVRYAVEAPTLTTRRVRVWCSLYYFDAASGDLIAAPACNTFVPLAG